MMFEPVSTEIKASCSIQTGRTRLVNWVHWGCRKSENAQKMSYNFASNLNIK
jgi:hypothetical protein